MWPFKKKIVKVEEIKEIRPQRPGMPDVLHNEDPWWISKDRDDYFYIEVYDFEKLYWTEIIYRTDEILGVNREEFTRSIREKYRGCRIKFDSCGCPYFREEEDCKRLLEEIRHFYDTFYMPRAVMRRLQCYTPGGYQPHFQWWADEHNIKVPERNEE